MFENYSKEPTARENKTNYTISESPSVHGLKVALPFFNY